MNLQPLKILVFLQVAYIHLVNCQKPASGLRKVDICAGKDVTVSCAGESASHMVFIVESYYGVQAPGSSKCGYTAGDCTQEFTINDCKSDQTKCTLSASVNRKLSNCQSNRANYLHVEYYCVPFAIASQNPNNICSNVDSPITTDRGILQAPSYPALISNTNCQRTITVPSGKSINIWVNDMSIGVRDSDGQCQTDSLTITDTTGTYIQCGRERTSYTNQFCSSLVIVSWKIGNKTTTNSRGFQLYYETFSSTSIPNCPKDPLTTQSSLITTTTTIANPGAVSNFEASQTFDFQICRGGETLTINAPEYHLIYIEKLLNGISPTLTCSEYAQSHCTSPAIGICNLRGQCAFKAPTNSLSECGNQPAQYLYGQYRFIPIQSTTNFYLGSSSSAQIDADNNRFGLLYNQEYPKWYPNYDYSRRIMSQDKKKAIRFYVTDIDIEYPVKQECNVGFVELDDGVQDPIRFCGMTFFQDNYEFISCSNSLSVRYVSGPKNLLQDYFRGFRAYYELVDKPSSCNVDGEVTTTQGITSTYIPPTYPVSNEVFSTVLGVDELMGEAKCVFPFKYQDSMVDKCVKDNGGDKYWCSTTSDYDSDRQKANCNLGFTNEVKFYTCRQKLQKFKCPSGYSIFVISAENIVTSDGSCNPNMRICSESALNIPSLCNGKESCQVYVSPSKLSSCVNSQPDILQIDFTCIPNSPPQTPVKDFCRTDAQGNPDTILTAPIGLIQTPNFPNKQKNIDCTVSYTSQANRRMLISIYMVASDLENNWSGTCNPDIGHYQINGGNRKCGVLKPRLLEQYCGFKFEINIKIGSKEYSGMKVYYEVSEIKDSDLCGEDLTTTTTRNPEVLTTTPALPIYAQQEIASETMSQTLCSSGKVIKCAPKYAIVVRKAVYGYSAQENCFFSPTDCVSYREVDSIADCDGKVDCYIPYTSHLLSECYLQKSNYINIEYDCIPTTDATSKTNMCNGGTFLQKKNHLKSPNWPKFDSNLNCEANIRVAPGKIIKAYIQDLSISDDEAEDALNFIDGQDSSFKNTYTGVIRSKFAIETCSNLLKIQFRTKNSEPTSAKSGVAIYYEEIEDPGNLQCQKTTNKPEPTASTSTIPARTTTKPDFFGFVSEKYSITGCGTPQTLACPADYIIIVETSVMGVRPFPVSTCSNNPQIDCMSGYSFAMQNCPGRQFCTIKDFQANTTRLPECGNRIADYFYVVYRCVPVNNANQPPRDNYELCKSSDNDNYLPTGFAGIYQNENFPVYPEAKNTVCRKNLTTVSGGHLRVWLTTASLTPTTGIVYNCSAQTKNFLTISDGITVSKFCRENKAIFVMQSRSNWLTIDFNLERAELQPSAFKGFQLFVQSYTNQLTTQPGLVVTTPLVVTVPSMDGFASQVFQDEVCSDLQKDIKCQNSYGIIIHQEKLVSTGNGCAHSSKECRAPTDFLMNLCTMKNTCNIYFPETEITGCGVKYADLLEYEYQCIPTEADQIKKEFSCGSSDVITDENGFLSSPGYPSYDMQKNCNMTIKLPDTKGAKLFILDLALRSDDCSVDFLIINEQKFCGNSLANLAFVSKNSESISIKYQSTGGLPANLPRLEQRGFRIYYEFFELDSLSTTQIPTTTVPFSYKEVKDSNESSTLNTVTFLFGIAMFILILSLILFVYRIGRNKSGLADMRVRYKNEQNDVNPENMNSFGNPLSI